MEEIFKSAHSKASERVLLPLRLDCRQASVVPFGSSLVMWLICLQDILLLSFPRDGEQVLDTLPPGCTVEVRNCSHDWLSKLLQLLLEKVKVAWLVFWLVQ